MKKLISTVNSTILALVSISMPLIGVGCSHAHDFSGEYKSDQASHWSECSCGEKADAKEHEDNNNDNVCDTCKYQLPEQSGAFDENNIVFSFGALSDLHVKKTMWDSNVAQIYAAFDQLLEAARKHDADGLDALALAGDLISNSEKKDAIAEEEIRGFVNILKEYANKDFGTNVMITCGNHDTRSNISKLPSLYDLLGAEYFANDVDSDLEKGYRHCVIGDYHFILAEPSKYGSGTPFADDVLKRLDADLKAITEANPEKYVFFFTHPQIYETTYGSEADFDGTSTYWHTQNVREVLEKSPQVISFSGHIHSPIADERCIMQSGFTAVNDGGVTSVAVEPHGYANVSGSLPAGSDDCSYGLLVQIDANGNVRITRMNFKDGETVKEPWELPYPQADRSHLKLYTREGRTALNVAPVLSGELTATVTPDGTMAEISFAAGTDDDLVHHYIVTVENASGVKTTDVKILSDYYWWSNPSQMAKTVAYGVRLTKGENKITVKAVDVWAAQSNALTVTVTSTTAPEALVGEFASFNLVGVESGKLTGNKVLSDNYLAYNIDYVGKITGAVGGVELMTNDDPDDPYTFARITSTGKSGKYAGVTVGLTGTFKASSFNVTVVMRLADDFAPQADKEPLAFRLRQTSVTKSIYDLYKAAAATEDADGFRTVSFDIDGNGGAVAFWIFSYCNESYFDVKTVTIAENANN